MHYSEKFAEALQYAATVHRLQLRKGTSIPYIGHLLGVTSIVIDAGGIEEEAIAAVLHDAAEDQGGCARLKDIEERFGRNIAAIVEGCSDSFQELGAPKLPWVERKKRYLAHLRACKDKRVYLVSVADKLHNARATLDDVRAERDVWKRFNATAEQVRQNYRDLIDAYNTGPPDDRRKPLVDALRFVIDQLSPREERSIFFDIDVMRVQGKKVSTSAPHPGSASGQKWEPDAATRAALGDSYGIMKEIIEEP